MLDERILSSENDKRLRADFPLLAAEPLAYLDNAATSQKPASVLSAVREYYEKNNANPMRGLYDLSVRATEAYEEARQKTAEFIGAGRPEEIVFTRNASESLNLIAYSWGFSNIKEGDELVVGITEHHSNFLPWQNLAKRQGAVVKFAECGPDGSLSPDYIRSLMSERTKLLAITQISNVLGRENDIRSFAAIAHEFGAIIVVDGAQSVPHIPVDVRALDADFLVFSGHKMLAPMGIGVLYGKYDLLHAMDPFLYGGEMIESVSRTSAVFAPLPHKFEAGTVNAGGAVGLSAAIDYIKKVGFETIGQREEALTRILFEALSEDPHIRIVGAPDPADHHGIVAFAIDDVHPHDIAEICSSEGVAIRAGHHCAQPLLNHLGHRSLARASLAFYNTKEEVLRFADTVRGLRGRMGYGS